MEKQKHRLNHLLLPVSIDLQITYLYIISLIGRTFACDYLIARSFTCCGLALVFLRSDDIMFLETLGYKREDVIGKASFDLNLYSESGRKIIDEAFASIGRVRDSNEMSELADYVLTHHERWDGSGYPKGLKGEEIPIEARIIALASSYIAMTSERPYRPAFQKEAALQEVLKNAGGQFDPVLAIIFTEKLNKQANWFQGL
ncbi:HD-GYP domain-containing protein [Desulfosporosinus sp. SB140]|uniref:HD-GYP domain-containing protein n=1 Tax=Desulfosporosinus paludis TaxID=3115649 RepID=UPI00388F470C